MIKYPVVIVLPTGQQRLVCFKIRPTSRAVQCIREHCRYGLTGERPRPRGIHFIWNRGGFSTKQCHRCMLRAWAKAFQRKKQTQSTERLDIHSILLRDAHFVKLNLMGPLSPQYLYLRQLRRRGHR